MDVGQQSGMQLKHSDAYMHELITKFSQLFQGLSYELDMQLANIRQLQHSQPNQDIAKQHIDKAIALLDQNHSRIRNQQTQICQQLRYFFVEQLGQTVNEPDIQNIKTLVQKLSAPTGSIWDGFRQLQAACSTITSINAQETTQGKLSSHTLTQLKGFIHQVELSANHSRTVKEALEQLATPLEHQQQLKQYNQIIETFSEVARQEQQNAQHFLTELNRAISHVVNTINADNTTLMHEPPIQQTLTEGMENSVSNLQQILESSNNIDTLKSSIQLQINQLKEQIVAKKQNELKQTERLTRSLNKTRSELKEVVNCAREFKQRLVKQQQISYTDALTKLPNRHAFEQVIKQPKQHMPAGKPVGWVAILDIDHFKKINDTFGHDNGDKVLCLVASILQRELKNRGFIARYGGEEFIALLPQCPQKTLAGLLEHIRHCVQNSTIHIKDQAARLTISIGVSQYHLHRPFSASFKLADEALYEAKSRSRNCVQFNSNIE